MSDDARTRREARKGLINIVIIDAIALAGVVAIFLYTNNFFYLIGGLVGAALITGPMVVRWYNEYVSAVKAPPLANEGGEGQ